MATLTVQGVEDALLEICGSRGANSDQFRKELNLALPRLYNMGMWHDLLFEHVVTTTTSTFTIPDNAESIISALVDSDSNSIDYSYPNTVYGPHHDYRIAGRNDRAGDHTLASFGIVDDGYSPTVEEPVDGKTYQLQLRTINPDTNLPNGNTETVHVTYSDGTNTSDPDVDEDNGGNNGGKFTCNNEDSSDEFLTTTANDITSISEIRVGPLGLSQPLQLLWVETGSSPTVTRVAASRLQEANQVTRYRRYRIDNRNEKTMSIRLLLKRKFQTLLSSTDVVYVSSLSAIKHAMLGNTAEDNADLERANYHWGICRAILDEELDAHRGAAKPRINFDPSGVGAYTNNMM